MQWPYFPPPGYEDVRPYAIERWYHRGNEVQVLSAIEMVSGESPEPRGEFHVSISGLKHLASDCYRISESRARWALQQFNFTDYVQDNHVPAGKVRNYWRPIAENQNPVCSCNEREPKVREMKRDYIWRP